MDQIIKASPLARSIYGYTSASLQSWCNYGYALLIIAGADGEVSKAEMDWLLSVHEKMLEAPGEVIEALSNYPIGQSSLEEVLPKIVFDVPLHYPRALIYDAIKMSYADSDFHSLERKAVSRAAEMLKIDLETAQTIEEIINMELAVNRARRHVLQIDKAAQENTIETTLIDSISLYVRKRTKGSNRQITALLADYGKALLTIGGADGDISDAEWEWLSSYFLMIDEYGIDALEEIEDFDYKNANLESVLAKLDTANEKGSFRSSLRRTLLYHAIQISRADQNYNPKEQSYVKRAAELLQIDSQTAKLINGLVETEEGIDAIRKAIFGVQA